MSRDPTWIVLSEDGSSGNIGRHREPEADDQKAAEEALACVGMGGWIAVQRQSVDAPGLPEIIEVLPLGRPTTTFEDARRRLLAGLRARKEP